MEERHGEERHRLETLVAIMDRLRGPDGCPWDREQTYGSLRSYLLEEAYEALEALDGVEEDEGKALCEELGDLLLQIVFLSRLAKEQSRFTVDDVIRGINDKMIRRHPHVFGEESAANSSEVLETWERIKQEEKAGKAGARKSLLDGLPQALPALMRAHRLGTKAARVGFDWQEPAQVLDKVDEELAELKAAETKAHQSEELGDTLFALVQLARKLDIDPEAALDGANRKFRRRFGQIEARLDQEGKRLDETGFERLEALWQEAKRS